ncbi:MAG: CHAT domain-containing protein [Nitrospira sp.]|nr:CHAT domain-containing protein [Nitrospira sp.]
MKSQQAPAMLQVSVLHGDLNHTNHPILLGHYEGDTIAGAERVVDKMVDGALSQRYHLGRYPGRNGTAAVELAPSNEIQQSLGVQHGAIVIGLGKWGDLTPPALTQAVYQGVTEYCLHIHQCRGVADSSKEPEELTINSLLIGSNTSANIAIEDSIYAVVRGVDLASRALAHHTDKGRGPMPPRVVHVQFIERFLDVAVDAAKSAHRMAKRIGLEFQTQIHVERYLKRGIGGLTRIVPSSTRGYWRRWTISALQDAAPPPSVSLPPVLKERLRTLLQEEKSKDPQVYRALLDLALTTQDLRTLRPHKLRYLALSDRARAEVTVQDNQPELIAQLIQRSITATNFNQDIAKTLFETLIPVDLKDSLRSLENVVFVLDEVTANYPWELMIEADKPLCVRAGVIRQLQTVGYDTRARDTTSRNAWVVGNPLTPSKYPDLPGAMEEANRVAALLDQANYWTEYTSIRLGAGHVLNGLFARPYRIIHIAGHGYYSEADIGQVGAKAGVVLSDGLFLTAAELAMLDPVPELVFLNCCYLGQMGGTAYNKMAASIAGELIRKGVRAVVAAGWPVQDEPALCFAESFYTELLNGRPFGLALKEARQKTWDKFPSSNTWGAYQAYGDPDFCLIRDAGMRSTSDEEVKVAAEEVLLQLEGLSQQLAQADEAKVREELSQVEKRCAPDWLKQGVVQERLGAAYAGGGLFKEAMEHYSQALKYEVTANPATLRAIEQWINCAVRVGEKEGDKAMIQAAIEKGRHLLALAKTAERLTLMGGARKKLAQLETDPVQIRVHLTQAAEDYREAADRQQQAGAPDPYPILNAVVVEVLLGKEGGDQEAALSGCEALAKEQSKETRSVWDAITIADVALSRAFIGHSLPEERNNLVNKYRAAFVKSSTTQREQDSALTHIKFIREMLKKVPQADRDRVASAIESLDVILKQLQPRDQPAAPSERQATAISTGPSRRPRRSKPSQKPLEQKKPMREKAGRRSTRHAGKSGRRRSSISS